MPRALTTMLARSRPGANPIRKGVSPTQPGLERRDHQVITVRNNDRT